MIAFSAVKINIGLWVLGKRPDGYHNIVSVLYPLHQIVEPVEVLPAFAFSYRCLNQNICPDEENTCVRAYRALEQAWGKKVCCVQIIHQKLLPAGAGLGSASANAAAVLKLINEVAHLGLEEEQLRYYAGKIGADVPFFIAQTPALAQGTGDKLRPVSLDLSPYHIVLFMPKEIRIATREAYTWVTPQLRAAATLLQALKTPVREWRHGVYNDFEVCVCARHPELYALKKRIYQAGALYVSMTGSGSCFYGIFEKEACIDPKDFSEAAVISHRVS